MADKIMRLVALADGSPHPLAGRYVVDYDPTILPGGVVKHAYPVNAHGR